MHILNIMDLVGMWCRRQFALNKEYKRLIIYNAHSVAPLETWRSRISESVTWRMSTYITAASGRIPTGKHLFWSLLYHLNFSNPLLTMWRFLVNIYKPVLVHASTEFHWINEPFTSKKNDSSRNLICSFSNTKLWFYSNETKTVLL